MKTILAIFAIAFLLPVHAKADGVKCERLLDKILSDNAFGTYYHPKFNKRLNNDPSLNSTNFYRADATPGSTETITITNDPKDTENGKAIDAQVNIYSKPSNPTKKGSILDQGINYDSSTCAITSYQCFPENAPIVDAPAANCQKYYQNHDTQFSDIAGNAIDKNSACVIQTKRFCDNYRTYMRTNSSNQNTTVAPVPTPRTGR
jgi:hypothetical protein